MAASKVYTHRVFSKQRCQEQTYSLKAEQVIEQLTTGNTLFASHLCLCN